MQQEEPGVGIVEMGVVISEEDERRIKAEIAIHPLFEQLLAAHVGCLRVATPIDQLGLIDAQLAESHHLLRSFQSHHYQILLSPRDKQDLDYFLVSSFPSSLLCFWGLSITIKWCIQTLLYLLTSIFLLGVLGRSNICWCCARLENGFSSTCESTRLKL